MFKSIYVLSWLGIILLKLVFLKLVLTYKLLCVLIEGYYVEMSSIDTYVTSQFRHKV